MDWNTRVIEVVCGPVEDIGNSLRLWRAEPGKLAFTWTVLSAPPDDYVLLENLAPDGTFSTSIASGPDGAAGIQITEPAGASTTTLQAGTSPTASARFDREGRTPSAHP